MTDLFYSNWGPGEGKIAKLIFECDNLEEAEIITHNASLRNDRTNIRISYFPPNYDPEKYYVQVRKKNKNNWFNEGGPDVEEKESAACYISGELSLLLYKIEYGIDDYAIVKFSNEKKKRKLKIYEGNFISINGCRYYMKEFHKS
jgi:hypothetical protein